MMMMSSRELALGPPWLLAMSVIWQLALPAKAEARSNIYASGCTGQRLHLSCQPQQKIAIKRVFYGVKKDSDCRLDTGGYRNPTDPGTRDFHVKVNNSECCRTSHTDCELDGDTMYPTLNTKCSGYPSCNLEVQKVLTREPCRYRPYTDYMAIVYDCVSAGDIASFCSDDVRRGKSLYLANQGYPSAISPKSQSYQCQCIIRTSHPQGIGIHTIDVLLAWADTGPMECRRNLRIQDPMTYQRDIQCANKGYYGFKSIYSRPVSNVTITLSSQPGDGMAFVWLQAKPNDADGFVEILCGQSLQNLLNRIRHQAESRQREEDAKKSQQEKNQGQNHATDKPEDDDNKDANVTVATATTKSRTLNSDLAAIVGGVVAAGFVMISIVIIAMACHCRRTRKEDRQLKALELQPTLTPEPLDMTSYCRYDYDDDHLCSINRSPVKMSPLADHTHVGSSFRPNGFTTIAHTDKCQIHRDLSSSALLPPGISTPPPASQNRLLLGGRSFREVHYPGDMSLRFVKPLMNISKSFTSSAMDCSEPYPQGHTTLPANRKAVLVSCGPKSPLGKRSKSVTFSQPVAMVTPLNSESEESVEKSVLSVEVDDPSYDNLNKLDIPDYPIIPGKLDLIKFSKWDKDIREDSPIRSKWDKEIREDSPIRSKSMSTFHNPNSSTPETKVFVTPTCDLRVNFDTDDLAYMSDCPSTFWSPPKRNGKPLVLPKPQKAELYETGV